MGSGACAPALADRGRHADDGQPVRRARRRLRSSEGDPLTNRICRSHELLDERLVHDRVRVARASVFLGEVTPACQREAERAEVAGCDGDAASHRLRSGVGGRPAGNVHASLLRARQRQAPCDGHRGHGRLSAQAFAQSAVEQVAPLRRVVWGRRQRDDGRQHLGRVDRGIGRQVGAGVSELHRELREEDHRQRKLRGQEAGRPAASAPARAGTSAVLQDGIHVGPGHVDRRKQREEQDRCGRHADEDRDDEQVG